MSALTDFLGGGGGGSSDKVIQREFTFDVAESGTIALPFSGTVDVYAVGAGGGAHYLQYLTINNTAFNNNNTGNTRGSPYNGGGGGGCAVREGMEVAKGDELVIAIGAGGALVNTNADEANNGAGGDTTVNTNSNNITISLTGGGGGCGGAGVNKKNGSGGTGSGGDSNYTGGRGGQHAGNTTTSPQNYYANQSFMLCGGGSAAYQGDGYQGGDLDYNHTGGPASNNSVRHWTGGGGIGGAAATVTISGTPTYNASGAPGGALSASTATDLNGYATPPAGPAGMQERNGNNLGDLAHPLGKGGGGRNSSISINDTNINTHASDIADFLSGPGAGQEPTFMSVDSNNSTTSNVFINNTGPGIFGGKGPLYYQANTNYHNRFIHKAAPNAFGGGAGPVAVSNSSLNVPNNSKPEYYGGQGLVRIVYNSFS